MSKGLNWMRRAARVTIAVTIALGLTGLAPARAEEPKAKHRKPPEVAFMRKFIDLVNPALSIEDIACADKLPLAIHAAARKHHLSWQTLFVLAWQESDFDCHAKNRFDRGGAYGVFQIRRLWEPVVGDPRENYFDPHLAADRASLVLLYYRQTDKFEELKRRRFVNPLLCLYNSGESLKINMRYCRDVGDKVRVLKKSWRRFIGRNYVAMDDRDRKRTQ